MTINTIVYFGVLVYVIQGCQVGYFGFNCTKPCRYPNFGDQYQGACNCTRDVCDHNTGCTSIEACDDGYYGQGCMSQCRYPYYGRKCQQTCYCIVFQCNNINGCENTTELADILTTKSEEVFDSESTFIGKHREAIIFGSGGLLLIIAMCVCLKLKKCNDRPNTCTQLEEKVDHRPDLYSCPSIDDLTRASYQSLQLDESFNPDLYENTRFSQSSTI